MGLFDFGKNDDTDNPPPVTKTVDPGWVHTPDGGFFSFLDIDPEELGLSGVGGVYMIWHAGIHPEWVFAGHSEDLAAALHNAGDNVDITNYEKNGGLIVAWAPVLGPYRPGVVKYIEQAFHTLITNPSAYSSKTHLVPVIPPTRQNRK